MRVDSVREDNTVRSPWQVGHGSSMMEPEPWQLVHGSENANEPWLRVVRPVPLHTGQSCAEVPGLAPVPRQVGQVLRSARRSGTVTPETASPNAIRTSVSTSLPRFALAALVLVAPRLNKPPKRSPRPPLPPPPWLRSRSLMSNPPAPPAGWAP